MIQCVCVRVCSRASHCLDVEVRLSRHPGHETFIDSDLEMHIDVSRPTTVFSENANYAIITGIV